MRLTDEDIIAKDNAHLIAVLCFLMYSKQEEDIRLQEKICKILEIRGVIESAEALYNLIK